MIPRGWDLLCLDASFKEKDGYFHATITGALSNDCTHPLSEKLVLYAAVTKLSNVLLDCRGIETTRSAKEILEFSLRTNERVRSYSSEGRIKEMRLAYLLQEESSRSLLIDGKYDPDNCEKFLITGDYEEAVIWLKSV